MFSGRSRKRFNSLILLNSLQQLITAYWGSPRPCRRRRSWAGRWRSRRCWPAWQLWQLVWQLSDSLPRYQSHSPCRRRAGYSPCPGPDPRRLGRDQPPRSKTQRTASALVSLVSRSSLHLHRINLTHIVVFIWMITGSHGFILTVTYFQIFRQKFCVNIFTSTFGQLSLLSNIHLIQTAVMLIFVSCWDSLWLARGWWF